MNILVGKIVSTKKKKKKLSDYGLQKLPIIHNRTTKYFLSDLAGWINKVIIF